MSQVSFSVRSPADGTVEFKISTSDTCYQKPSLAHSIFKHIKHFILLAVRICVIAAVILSVFARWYIWYISGEGENGLRSLAFMHTIISSSWQEWILWASMRVHITNLKWMYHLPLSGFLIWLATRRHHIEESLLVIHGLGVQTTSASSNYWCAPTVRFIPTSSIQDILIHEAFKGFEVRFYLCIVIKNEPEVVVIFPKLLPRLAVLEQVWRGTRKCLYSGESAVQRDEK